LILNLSFKERQPPTLTLSRRSHPLNLQLDRSVKLDVMCFEDCQSLKLDNLEDFVVEYEYGFPASLRQISPIFRAE